MEGPLHSLSSLMYINVRNRKICPQGPYTYSAPSDQQHSSGSSLDSTISPSTSHDHEHGHYHRTLPVVGYSEASNPSFDHHHSQPALVHHHTHTASDHHHTQLASNHHHTQFAAPASVVTQSHTPTVSASSDYPATAPAVAYRDLPPPVGYSLLVAPAGLQHPAFSAGGHAAYTPAPAPLPSRRAPAASSSPSSQYHGQDETGSYAFGYSNVHGTREESYDSATGEVTGSYSGSGGRTVCYKAGRWGFQIV